MKKINHLLKLLLVGVFVSSVIACSKTEDEKTQEKVDNGNAHIAEMNTISSSLIKKGIFLSYPMDINSSLTDSELDTIKSSLNRYIELADKVLAIIAEDNIIMTGGSESDVRKFRSNANVYLQALGGAYQNNQKKRDLQAKKEKDIERKLKLEESSREAFDQFYQNTELDRLLYTNQHDSQIVSIDAVKKDILSLYQFKSLCEQVINEVTEAEGIANKYSIEVPVHVLMTRSKASVRLSLITKRIKKLKALLEVEKQEAVTTDANKVSQEMELKMTGSDEVK